MVAGANTNVEKAAVVVQINLNAKSQIFTQADLEESTLRHETTRDGAVVHVRHKHDICGNVSLAVRAACHNGDSALGTQCHVLTLQP